MATATPLVDDGIVSLYTYEAGPAPRLPLCMCGGGLLAESSLLSGSGGGGDRLGRVLAHVRPVSSSGHHASAGGVGYPTPWCREVVAAGGVPSPAVVASGRVPAFLPGSAKDAAVSCVQAMRERLQALGSSIHAHPELNFEEHHAHRVLTGFLEAELGEGAVEAGYLGLPTSFRATAGAGSPRVVICAEYDALPGIGHACGHNLIAEAAVAAFCGARAALEARSADGIDGGSVVLLGTPAEEGGGGKVELLNLGAFDDCDCAMMVHPAPTDGLYPNQTACECCRVTYSGRNAHAAAFPHEGINALDAVVQAFVNIGLLRQQLRPEWRVSGIITKGGVKTNIIPDLCEAEFQIRAPTRKQLRELKGRVSGCLEASALASGCEVSIEWSPPDVLPHPYDEMVSNPPMCEAFRANIGKLGTTYLSREREAKLPGGSTDMGNVSHVVPSIHPKFAIQTEFSNHHPGFTEFSNLPGAHACAIRAGQAMAATIVDLWGDPSLLGRVQEAFASQEMAS
jgi:amidohydrolase